MAGFVQNRLDVALQPDGVHENKRHPRFGQRGLVAARRFAFAVGQVEQAQLLHPPEAAGQLTVQLLEDLLRAGDHLLHLLERSQRGPVQRVHRQVPGPQRLELEAAAAARPAIRRTTGMISASTAAWNFSQSAGV